MNRSHPAGLFAVLALTGLSFLVSPDAFAQQLYVGNDSSAGGVLQFTLPINASSTSNFSIPSNNVVAVALDVNGNLAVGDFGGNLKVFPRPLSAASTPSASFKNGSVTNDGQLVFTTSGDFFAATVVNRVNFFTHPFTNASTPSSSLTDAAMVSTIGLALDAAQNLYIANAAAGTSVTCSSGAATCSNILVYAPPYTGAPVVTPNIVSTAYRKMAVSATQLFVASVAGPTGRVDVYNLPITTASVPAFSIVNGINTPEGVAVDAAGSLYIGNLTDATVAVYSPPFSAASAPTTVLQVSTGQFALFGIAIGTSQPLRRRSAKH